jgi:hypothetical protein
MVPFQARFGFVANNHVELEIETDKYIEVHKSKKKGQDARAHRSPNTTFQSP